MQFYIEMDDISLQIYERIVSTLFNDGIINSGRLLYVFTRKLCRQNPAYAERLWSIYLITLNSLNIPINARLFTPI